MNSVIISLIQSTTGLSKDSSTELWSDYYNEGLTLDTLSKKYFIPVEVLYTLRLRNVKVMQKNDIVRKLYVSGKTTTEIAKITGRSVSTISNILRNSNLDGEFLEVVKKSCSSTEWRNIYEDDHASHYIIGNKGHIINTKTRTLLQVHNRKNHSNIVLLSKKDCLGNFLQKNASKVVALTFCDLGELKAGSKELTEYVKQQSYWVSHNNGNVLDLSVDNLTWIPVDKGYRRSKHPAAKVTQEAVNIICKLISEGKTNDEIRSTPEVKEYPLGANILSNIRTKRAWNDISDKYFTTPIKAKRGNN